MLLSLSYVYLSDRNDQRMALVQMNTAEEAISALIVTHNHKISDTNHLRVTFSKNTL